MPKTGFDCKLFRNTGTHDDPVWVEMKPVADVRMPTFEWGKGEIKTRQSRFKAYLKTMFDLGVEVDYLYKAVRPQWRYMRDAALSHDDLTEFWVADGPAAADDTEGPRFYAQVFSLSGNQELENVNMTTFQLAPTYAVDEDDERIEPDWYQPNPEGT